MQVNLLRDTIGQYNQAIAIFAPRKQNVMKEINHKSLLLEERVEIFRRIISLVGSEKRPEIEHLIKALDENDSLLKHLEQRSNPSEYDDCPNAIDAVKKFLTNRGHSASRIEIVEALVTGGFDKGKGGVSGNVRRSLTYFLDGSGKSQEIIKEAKGSVGLFEWPLSRFARNGLVQMIPTSLPR